MVSEGLHHVDAARNNGIAVDRVLREGILRFAVDAGAVGLDVRLADDVDALAVAELVPGRVVGVVARPDGVDVEVVEDLDVLLHPLERDGVARPRLHLVAVDAHEESALPVDIDYCVLYLNLAETECDRIPVALLEESEKARMPDLDSLIVHVRCLAAPELRVLVGLFEKRIAVRVAHDERAGLVVVRKLRVDDDVARRLLGLRHKPHVAEDPGEAPEVLVFKERAIAVLQDLYLERVLAVLQERRDVELGRKAAVLRISDFLAVDAEEHRRRHAAEVDDDATVLPVGGDRERARV